MGRRFAAAAISAAIVSATLVVAAPAQACACGAFLVSPDEEVAVDSEAAIIGWDGTTERIIVSIGVESEAPDLALLIPTPSPATVSVAEPGLFDELDSFTEPRIEHVNQWWPEWVSGAGGDDLVGAPAVSVVETVDLGDMTADVLQATDADALAQWLQSNDYVMRDDIASALVPYIQQDWYYVAVKLAAEDFSGELQPLDISFEANQLVYPMRLSATSPRPIEMRTYVFAEHRMERTDPMGGEMRWAGPVAPTDFVDQTLVEMAGEHGFLTAWQEYYAMPSEQIVADMSFAASSTDESFELVRTVVHEKLIFGAPAGPTLVFGALILIGAAGATVSRVRRRQRLEERAEDRDFEVVGGARTKAPLI